MRMKKSGLGWLGGVVISAMAALSGCEGTTTGAEFAAVALQPAVDGRRAAYEPVKFTLSPDMNPIAFNFRADNVLDATEYGKWNGYRATLSRGGTPVAMKSFSANSPTVGEGNSPPPTTLIRTLFYVDVDAAGEYELTIVPDRAPQITLKDARVDARRNVQRPPQ